MPDPVIVPFPNAGTATIRESSTAAVVNMSGSRELIVCTITVSGGMPAFVFARNNVAVHSADQFPGHPKKRYQWILSAEDGSLPIGDAAYALNVSFLGALKYTYLMEHCDEFGARLKLLKDIDYESADPHDSRVESILIQAT
jgi:hypothetical protein